MWIRVPPFSVFSNVPAVSYGVGRPRGIFLGSMPGQAAAVLHRGVADGLKQETPRLRVSRTAGPPTAVFRTHPSRRHVDLLRDRRRATRLFRLGSYMNAIVVDAPGSSSEAARGR